MPFTLLGETYNTLQPFFGQPGFVGKMTCTGFVYAYLKDGVIVYVGRTHQFLAKRHAQHMASSSTAFDRALSSAAEAARGECKGDAEGGDLVAGPYRLEVLTTCACHVKVTSHADAKRALQKLEERLVLMERQAIRKHNPPMNIQDAGSGRSRHDRSKPPIPVKKPDQGGLAKLADILTRLA